MKILKGQFIPRGLLERRDLIFLGEKPSDYFLKHPEDRHMGNYNAPRTIDKFFQKQMLKYFGGAVYATDMVKTEGEAGAVFESEWKQDSTFTQLLIEELELIRPKIIVVLSKKTEELFRGDKRLDKWKNSLRRVYHPSGIQRFKKQEIWDKQFAEIVEELNMSK